MELTRIPVPCWVCGEEFYAPARMSTLPPRYVDPRWYGKQASASVWVYIDREPIAEHTAAHWPVLVMLFYYWKSFTECIGLDPLEWYARPNP